MCGKVDATRIPGRIELDDPNNSLIFHQLFFEVFVVEVNDILWALIGWLREQE